MTVHFQALACDWLETVGTILCFTFAVGYPKRLCIYTDQVHIMHGYMLDQTENKLYLIQC